jgi:hypothetical protein
MISRSKKPPLSKKPSLTELAADEVQNPTLPGPDIDIAPNDLCTGAHDGTEDLAAYHARPIIRGWQKTVSTILEVSKRCATADEQMPDDLRQQFYDSLPFDRTIFQKLAAIGRSPALHNPQVLPWLPPHYSILYAARNLTPAELDRAHKEKIITPDAKRAVVKEWVKNCRSDVATRDAAARPRVSESPTQVEATEPRISFSEERAHDENDFAALLDAWNTAPRLTSTWQKASEAVRQRFIRTISDTPEIETTLTVH